jgi:predicted phage terminase large subunit-like protein
MFELLQRALSKLPPEQAAAWLRALPEEQQTWLVKIREDDDKELCEKSFFEFVRQSFPYITQDTAWVDNWHYEILCNDLQDIVQRVIDNLPNEHDYFVNLPPRTYKSKIVSVCLNAWVWIQKPSVSFFVCSRNIELCNQHASDTRTLIESKWYQRNWGNVYRLNNDAECSYGNDKGGERWKVAPNSIKGIGFGCSIMVYDDIDDPEQVYRESEREAVLRLVSEKMSRSRFNDPKTGARIFLQQRCHVDDISGFHYKNNVYPVKKLVLPAEDSDIVFPPYLREHYREHGGLLFPARLDASVLASQKAILRNSYSGQYGQNPIPATGNMFNPGWPKWYAPGTLPKLSRTAICADTANTSKASSCPASIQIWGQSGPNFYLILDDTEIMSIKETERRIAAYAKRYSEAYIVIENASSGFAIIESLKLTCSKVFEFNPVKYGSKEKRAEMTEGYWEAGNIFLPDVPSIHSDYLPEICSFPKGHYRDRVDCMSMALIWFMKECSAAVDYNWKAISSLD